MCPTGKTRLCACRPSSDNTHRALPHAGPDPGGESSHARRHHVHVHRRRRQADMAFYFRELVGLTRQIRNIIVQCGRGAGRSVPLPVPLGVVLVRSLRVVEVEGGHHVSHGQHQPVQALVVVQSLGPSVLLPLPLHAVTGQ